MIHLVYGGSGSGKSAYAENLVMTLNTKNKYYLATMKIYGEEGLKKVQRHRELRAGKGFVTIEKETLDDMEEIKKIVAEKDSVILLECLSNLTANEMFREDRMIPCREVSKKICSGLKSLGETAENLVIVSNNIFEDGIEYDESTKEYMKALGEINIFAAEMADKVTEVVCSISVEVK